MKTEQKHIRSELNTIKQPQAAWASDIKLTDSMLEKCQELSEKLHLAVEYLANTLETYNNNVYFCKMK